MFDHVGVSVSDLGASREFYDLVLEPLDLAAPHVSPTIVEWNDFAIGQTDAEHPVTRHLHVAFVAQSRELVSRFWLAGTEAGHPDFGAPGPRPEYNVDYFGGFLLDPDGNHVEAVHHDRLRRDGVIDHLWIRVADVDASRRFYETIAPHAGLELRRNTPGRARFVDRAGGSFSLVAGDQPTEHVHIAFVGDSNAKVEAFHEAAIAAGYRDNGGPGERAVYHPGYYGAFVLDPDGNNIELVNHNG
jgi:catechol 2,3-dioxygenase-like lactoylglutathione lyase family enzyme